MCVIAYKPNNIAFPSETILKNCYENNPDGAGFMYAYKGVVHIQKGYETWEAFRNALEKARKLTGDKIPYVMHFRIATQGFEKCMTHPFALSGNMKKLKKLHTDCNIGVAHNGILDITSDGSKEYSDTMKFITDYLSLIIRSYSWYNDDRTKTLIERLIEGSRLAILDKRGHCELMGKGWIKDNDVYYSNSSYSYSRVVVSSTDWQRAWWDAWEDEGYYDDGYSIYPNNTKGSVCSNGKGTGSNKKSSVVTPEFDTTVQEDRFARAQYYDDKYYNHKTGEYDFTETKCPSVMDNDDSYCICCSNASKCKYMRSVVNWK